MGHVSAPFGVKGWVKVQPYTETVDALLDYPVWWLDVGGQWRECQIAQAEAHHKTVAAKLEGYDDRDRAEDLKGCRVAVTREAMPEAGEGEYYCADLIGLQVVNREGVLLGRVARLLETGANDVLVVDGGSGERLIPFVGAYIDQVDIAGGMLRVDWGTEY